MADPLYTLGGVLRTGVVLVVFVQIYPEAQKRQYKRALDAYEATVGAQAGAGSGPARSEAAAFTGGPPGTGSAGQPTR